MLTHRNKKPFECDAEGCGKSYCDARSLRRHKENHHSSTSSNNLSASLSSQVSVIPGLAHLGFNSLQTSFPASVITSSSGPAFTESSLANRIQYAPPPTTTSLSGRASSANTENLSRTVSSSVVSSVIPTAASHLQFLTFQQQPSSKGQQQVASSSPKNITRSDSNTVLTSWQPQTINTGALLLAQNFGASQSIDQTQSTQLLARSFETSNTEQGNSSGSELSQSQLGNAKQEKSDILSQDTRDQNRLEQPVLSETCFEVVNSSSGAKQIVALTPQGSVNLQFDSGSGTVVRLQEHAADSIYSRSSMQIVKIETSDQSSTASSVPTTPTSKESSNCTQLGSPLLQQLLNQQQNAEVSTAGIVNSRSEQSYLPSMQEQQKQSSAQQSSVLISPWSQVPYAVPNSASTSRYNSQDPKPVECSLC
ncbi:Zinc finger protein 541, partial [Stegodyphus mimosarum]